MARKKSNKSNAFERALLKICFGLFLLAAVIALIGSYPVLIIVPIAIVTFLIWHRVRQRRIEAQIEMENMQIETEMMMRQQTIGKLIADFHGRPHDFEGFVAKLFSFYGYETEVTPGSSDGGKDIVMRKDGRLYVVEVKLYATYDKISREKIQKLHSAQNDCHADQAIFVTTSNYTAPAIEFAERNGIRLINGDELVEMLEERRSAYRFSHNQL